MADLVLDVGPAVPGGACLARHDGRAVLVRHALPGERVRVELTSDDKVLRGDAVEVLDASDDRVPAPCPYAGPGRCGGCDWQHVTGSRQRALKADVVADQLRRVAGLEVQVDVAPVGDGDLLGWRTRVQFAVRDDGVVGLRRHRSHDVEPVERCLIAHAGVTEVGVERRSWPGTSGVELIASSLGDRAVVVTPRGRKAPLDQPLDVATSLLCGDGRGGATPVRGRPGVREQALGRTWRVSGSGFWQVHPEAAETLASAVVELLDPGPGETALDLYGGVGLFAAALAPHLRSVVLVEASAAACDDARHNLADLRVDVECGSVASRLPALGLGRVDLAVLDPPRTGAGAAVMAAVAALRPRRIAYVACDPGALARDIAACPDYAMRDLRAYDIFPMTHHVECVALLEPV